jgi:hypothetical protein
MAWCTSFISTSYALREHFPWKAGHVKTALFQDFDARIAVHDAPIECHCEGLRLPLLERHSVCASFQALV